MKSLTLGDSPIDVQFEILKHLSCYDLSSLSKVNKANFLAVYQNARLWKKLVERDFPHENSFKDLYLVEQAINWLNQYKIYYRRGYRFDEFIHSERICLFQGDFSANITKPVWHHIAARAVPGVSSGVHTFEVKIIETTRRVSNHLNAASHKPLLAIGVATEDVNVENFDEGFNIYNSGAGMYNNGHLFIGGKRESFIMFRAGDYVSVTVDMDNHEVWFGINNDESPHYELPYRQNPNDLLYPYVVFSDGVANTVTIKRRMEEAVYSNSSTQKLINHMKRKPSLQSFSLKSDDHLKNNVLQQQQQQDMMIFADQLKQLAEMGFHNTSSNREILKQHNGILEDALPLIISASSADLLLTVSGEHFL